MKDKPKGPYALGLKLKPVEVNFTFWSENNIYAHFCLQLLTKFTDLDERFSKILKNMSEVQRKIYFLEDLNSNSVVTKNIYEET